jgi:hypothetical protein
MCSGIALTHNAVPLELIEREWLYDRLYERGGEQEFQFLFRQIPALLPVWHEGQLRILRWGNRRRQSRRLPCTSRTSLATIESGGWSQWRTELVEVPAQFGLEKGVWFQIKQGIRALLVYDEDELPIVYLICQPATHYFQVMTRSSWMPVLVEQVV